MTVERDFNLFVGCETGILKGVNINPKANLQKNFHQIAKLDKQQEITCMATHVDPINEREELILGLRNQMVKVFDTTDKCFRANFDASVDLNQSEQGSLVGVARCQDSLVTANRAGVVRVWRHPKRIQFNTIDTEVKASGKLKHNNFESDEDAQKHLALIKSGRELCRLKRGPDNNGTLIATGGKENDLQLWDLEKPDAPIFRAKNVKHDTLELRVPVWVADIAFPDAHAPHLVTYANKHGHIRLYDTRSSQRRPAKQLEWKDESLTAISNTNSVNSVLVGTAQGKMALFDFRAEHKGMDGMVRKYKGAVGSIRSIYCNYDKPFFAAVGLDRFLRVYAVNSKKIISKVYLKSRLNTVFLRPGFDPHLAPEGEGVMEDPKSDDESEEEIDEGSDVEIIHEDNDESSDEDEEPVTKKSKQEPTKKKGKK